ncbi:MAG: DUF2807 domain-containing protein [Bacteroidales bacterium]|nr:DUF2807 domain-containing protein [Bacteroidales bacterium]
MKKISLLLVLMLTMASLSAQSIVRRELIDFSNIVYSVSGDLFITIGNTYEVRLEGDGSYIENVITKCEKGKLTISQDKRYKEKNTRVAVYVTLPILNTLTLNTSESVYIYGTITQDNFTCKTSGIGNLSISSLNISKQAKFTVAGAGSVNILEKCNVSKLYVLLSNSGDFKGTNANANEMTAIVKKGVSCECSVTKKLNATIQGSGDIIYSGNPKITAKLNGSGKLQTK